MEGPGQILANSLVELDRSLELINEDGDAAVEGLSALASEVRQGLVQLQALVAELQPPLLQELGLGPSLRQYAEQFGLRHDIRVECNAWDDLSERLPSVIETSVFRIVQEALANIVEHSGATRVRVRLTRVADRLRAEVEDNGRGFAGAGKQSGKRRQLGLAGMNDRAALVGGRLHVYSRTGHGLRVVLEVPYHSWQEQKWPAKGGRSEDRHSSQNGRKGQDHR